MVFDCNLHNLAMFGPLRAKVVVTLTDCSGLDTSDGSFAYDDEEYHDEYEEDYAEPNEHTDEHQDEHSNEHVKDVIDNHV